MRKILARIGAEARAVGDVEVLEREAAERVGVVALRQHHRGDGRRVVFRIAAHDLEAPGAHRAARRLGEAVVAGEHVVEPFLVQHVDADGEPVQHLGRRRVGEEADLVHVEHVVPGPERLQQLRGLRRRQRLVADRIERHAGRQHQALLRAADGDVDAPLVVAVVGRGERRDGVDQEQRRMAGGVDRLADFGDRRQAAGRGLVVQDADRLDLVRLVLAQVLLDHLRVGADAPVGLDEFRLEADLLGHHLPERGELAGLDHQHAVAGRQRVDQRRFPRAGAGRGVDDDRVGGLEDGLDAFEAALGELGEFRTAMVDDRRVHGAQDAVGQRRRPRNLQEVAADGARGVLGHQQFLNRHGRYHRLHPAYGPARPQLAAMNDECDSQSRLFAGAVLSRGMP